MENIRYDTTRFTRRRLFKYAPYVIGAILALSIPVLLTLRVDAEVAVFVSDNHVEQETVLDVVDESGITYIERERIWSNFQGSVPEGVSVNKIVFRLAWSEGVVVTETLPVADDDGTNDASVPLIFTGTTTIEVNTGGGSEEGHGGEQDVVDTDEDAAREAIPAEFVVTETIESEDMSIDLVAPIREAEVLPESSNEEDEQDTLPVEVIEPSVDEETFEPVSLVPMYPWVTAMIEEDVSSTTPSESISESDIGAQSKIENENEIIDTELVQFSDIIAVDELNKEILVTSDIGTTSTSTNTSTSTPLTEGSIELRYTTDGVHWVELGSIEYGTVSDAEFFLASVALEDIPRLQVSLRYIVREGSDLKLYFDVVRLEAEYSTLIEEAVFIEGVPSDQEPNFKVSAIKTDISEGNIRAVLLERGGLLEFWYSVTNERSDEVLWRKLVGGGAIEEGAPIAIKERTIFWFDKNQETLLGFSVDAESLFGVPFENPEERTFRLPFESENDEQWLVTYDPDENVLKFVRIRKASR